VLVIGKESAGKSRLTSSITGRAARATNFRGSTIGCEIYEGGGHVFVDTPGILRRSDSATTKAALNELQRHDVVLLVVQATHLDEDLDDLLPLVKGKRGVVVVTFWDKVDAVDRAREMPRALSRVSGLPFVPVDARTLSENDRADILAALTDPQPIRHERLAIRVGWRIEPPRTWMDHQIAGPLAALVLLLVPAMAAVWVANAVAAVVEPVVSARIQTGAQAVRGLSALAGELLAGRYGLLTMGPLLFVWAVPTVVIYALMLGVYKASGLLDRITIAIHPVTRPFGLVGRDLVRVIMGFGCNVPAVISTRACSACSRRTCISAIAFGAACSYQFGATLAVFSATRRSILIVPYSLYLCATTLVYTRLTAPRVARSRLNPLLLDGRSFLELPRWSAIWLESSGTLRHFFRTAIPIFFLITIIASILDRLGVITHLATVMGPVMAAFRLPSDAALPVLLASIRKDGILLFVQGDTTRLTAAQLLTGVYLAGVLLPCLVTALTIGREQSWRYALALMSRQACAAICFSLILAWTTALVGW
jgi:Fe2+ transport system protein B